MDKKAIDLLIEKLDSAALAMREASDIMKRMDKHPIIQQHGLELGGAANMIDEWIDGISNEIPKTTYDAEIQKS